MRKAAIILIIFLSSNCIKSETRITFHNSPAAVDSTVIYSLTKDILTALKNDDLEEFAEYIHPKLGVRFSPYSYIDTATDLVFKKKKFLKNSDPGIKLVYLWGYYDGSGDTIYMTMREYFKKFVYDVDFLNAEITSFNLNYGHSNTINNIYEIYEGLPFTESYFSGFEEQFGGMDWRALRLVYKEYKGKYYLVGVIHDEWTI